MDLFLSAVQVEYHRYITPKVRSGQVNYLEMGSGPNNWAQGLCEMGATPFGKRLVWGLGVLPPALGVERGEDVDDADVVQLRAGGLEAPAGGETGLGWEQGGCWSARMSSGKEIPFAQQRRERQAQLVTIKTESGALVLRCGTRSANCFSIRDNEE